MVNKSGSDCGGQEIDRPITPEIQQYNPALADKRFRGKAVQYCLLRRFNDYDTYSSWIRLQKVTRDKRTDTETGIKVEDAFEYLNPIFNYLFRTFSVALMPVKLDGNHAHIVCIHCSGPMHRVR